ncbi:MAG TPA: M28 family peptidase [Terriglobales bacterium]|nr:M28 family peptidase [Terriglobales bacterium]
MSESPQNTIGALGWHALLDGFPWFSGKGNFPLPAYSEFMPPPRLGRKPYGEPELRPFSDDDPFGWAVTEVEEEYELGPGLEHLAGEIVGALRRLGGGQPEFRIPGYRGRNLADNPYCPPELQAAFGRLPRERCVALLPLALSRTQDDKGRVRWTFFGSSEQGPEQAFWQGFYAGPGRELPAADALGFFGRLFAAACGGPAAPPASLRDLGFRILPTEPDPRFPYWRASPLPSWTAPLIVGASDPLEGVRCLLTFRPFARLPEEVRKRYLSGDLALLPFPASLLFWGERDYVRLQDRLPLAMQVPLQRLAARRDAPGGLRVPQSGWLHEEAPGRPRPDIPEGLVLNTFKRTNRWDRARRNEDDVAMSRVEHGISRTLFSTALDALGLYNKPMARNCQIWAEDSRLLMDGPRATPAEILRAFEAVSAGGLFRYRFQYPAMRVGRREVYWHRPLAASWSGERSRAEVVPGVPAGFLTAYPTETPDPARPMRLWPRLLRREPQLAALRAYEHLREHYSRQTPLNVLALLGAAELSGGRPLPGAFARNLLCLAEGESLDAWLAALVDKASDPALGRLVRQAVERLLEPPSASPGPAAAAGPAAPSALPEALTFARTATRAFEEALWNDIAFLAHGRYVNKDNADCVQDAPTQSRLTHRQRDLEALGDYLLGRHREAVRAAGLKGKALCGEVPFLWRTDFDFTLFGGWNDNRDGRAHERDLLVVIPGRDRREAVVLADHYDTAYMEDEYEKDRGGSGARIAAAGADDNHSATATLLRAAPVFLELAKAGRLERDVWLLHLTGEEFPADCMGARHFCRALVEGTLRLETGNGAPVDLSGTRVAGVFVMDMIAHNLDREKDVFQISPGAGASALELARHAHDANRIWNARAEEWNRSPERRGRGRGKRSADGRTIPQVALHPRLRGEVRTAGNPLSSLYNTDGQVFSDIGVPVVLFMENYDIDRTGYHDTKDTLEMIDLDYGAAVAAIAIEAAARAAAGPPKVSRNT